MSATNKAQRAATLSKALASQQVELRGGSNARILQNYRVELGTENATTAQSDFAVDHDPRARALATLQANRQIELDTTNPGL